MSRPVTQRARALRGALVAFLGLAGTTALLLAVSSLLGGADLTAALHPLHWLADLNRDDALGLLSDSAGTVSGVLGIAITVVAIVVELAATRYSHQITSLFIREPINIVVMNVFVLTTLLCVWVAVTLSEPTATTAVPYAAFVLTMGMITLSLLLLLPYFAFVFSFLSPLSIIEQLRRSAYKAMQSATSGSIATERNVVSQTIDELQDVARSATELSDRGIAMACVDALTELVLEYEALQAELPAEWFRMDATIARDPDFVSLAPSALVEIEQDRVWVQVKVFHQFLSLVNQSIPEMRDVANLIAIDTQRIGAAAAERHPELIEQCIRGFNSYLRITIRTGDIPTGTYVLNHYRLFAESLLEHGRLDAVRTVASHFQYYGVTAHAAGHSFLLEVAAHDLVQLIIRATLGQSPLVDDLIGHLLQLDQEIKLDSQEDSLMGVRRAQIQLATFFLQRGEEVRARRIAADLASERRERLARIRSRLQQESEPQYWEYTPRGVNFAYLEPELRPHLDTLFGWLNA